jgi:hypothetical protein
MRPEMLAVQGFDLDHIGAHVAQDLAGGRAGDDLREVEDERVGERKHLSEEYPCWRGLDP